MTKYHIYPKPWDKQAWANTADPDQMLLNMVADQGLHCHSYSSFDTSLDFKSLGKY